MEGTVSSSERLQAAVRETALAYYWKNIDVQYDAKPLTPQNGGATRLSSGSAPELAAPDQKLYSVCSDFMYDVYYNALGYKFMGCPRACGTPLMVELPVTDPRVVVKFGGPDGRTDREAALRDARACLQVGDVIVGYGTSGHAMLYIGDFKGDGTDYIIHCWGKSYDIETGYDPIEVAGRFPTAHPKGGAIRIDSVDEFCFTEEKARHWSLKREESARLFVILRPLNDPKIARTLPAWAEARLRYPGICIDRDTGLLRYKTALTGDTVSVRLTVTNNHSEAYTDLVLTDPIPEGAEFVPESATEGGKLEGAGVYWRAAVPAGEAKTFSYRVRVTAKPGEWVKFGGGSVGEIPTRSLCVKVGFARLGEDALRAAADAARGDFPPALLGEDLSEGRFANACYRHLFGLDPKLPERFNDLCTALLKRIPVFGVPGDLGGLWTPKTARERTEEENRLCAMVIPEHLAGYYVWHGDDPAEPTVTKAASCRVRVYQERYYEVGDLFFALGRTDAFLAEKPGEVSVYLYLGNGSVASWDLKKGVEIVPFEETIPYLLNRKIVIALRPLLAGRMERKG